MMLDQITRQVGSHKRRKRVGRGESSGSGKTCGRGNKGCQSRSGGGTRPLHEGGQMPIFRRLPKRGFSNYNFRTEHEIINLGTLERCFNDGDNVDLELLQKLRLVHARKPLVKVLGTGALSKRITIAAHAFSAKARTAIEQAGGTAKLIERRTPQEAARAKRNTAKSAATKKSPKPSSKETPKAQEKS
ncbi:MAG: 50S ribosomal protein L15 [Planctomycetes bacterium]|nr:50S ribosomal protein L15 [Planctomycetota bacterium]